MIDYMILAPHQDDEMLACYSIMERAKERCRVTIVFKGGGEPKPNPYRPEELYKIRCMETVNACSKLGVRDFDFLRINRGTPVDQVKKYIKNYLELKEPRCLFTSYPFDNHPEHLILGEIVRELGIPAFGFVIHTGCLDIMRESLKPTLNVHLGVNEYSHKINLINEYKTQSHFLPNIVRRRQYRDESFWRIQ